MIGQLKDERYIAELAKYAENYFSTCVNYDDAYKFYTVMYSYGYDPSTSVEKLIKDSNTNLTQKQGEELICFSKWVRYAIFGET